MTILRKLEDWKEVGPYTECTLEAHILSELQSLKADIDNTSLR